MTLFHIKDTKDHEDYILLPYAVVVFLLAFFIRHNPINQAFGRIDVDTIHHDVLTRALQWVNDKLEDENPDLSSVSTLQTPWWPFVKSLLLNSIKCWNFLTHMILVGFQLKTMALVLD